MDTNKKAISDRGWGPLNKILLQHPEISCSKPSLPTQQNLGKTEENDTNKQVLTPSSSQDTSSKVEIEDINFNSGYAGEVIQTILKKAQRDEQTLRNIEESKEKGLNFCDSIEKVKKWSAGIIFKTGKCMLDKDVLTMAINAKQKKDNNFIEKVTKLYCEYCEKKIEYEKSVQEITQLKIEDAKLIPLKFLKPVCAYKKRKGDKALPTK